MACESATRRRTAFLDPRLLERARRRSDVGQISQRLSSWSSCHPPFTVTFRPFAQARSRLPPLDKPFGARHRAIASRGPAKRSCFSHSRHSSFGSGFAPGPILYFANRANRGALPCRVAYRTPFRNGGMPSG